MKKKDIITGSILEVPLEKEYGYGYTKLIFSKDIQPDSDDNTIIKVYNLFRKESLSKQDFKKEIFETDDLALYPLLTRGYPNVRGEHKWILKGFSNLTEEDRIIPDYLNIGMHRKFCTETIKEATRGKYGCPLIRNFDMKRIAIKNFEAIKHIGQWIHSSTRAIRTTMTMYWIHRNGDSIRNYYTKEDFGNNFWLEFTEDRIKDYDIDFTEIKHKNRLKAQI